MRSSSRPLAAIAAAACLAASSCARPPLRIGLSVQLSGRMAEVGLAVRNGATLAVEEANASGGAGGRRLILLTRDDRGDPELAREADAELAREGASALVGHLTSSLTLAARPEAERAGLVVLSPWASSSLLLKPGASFFMIFSSSDEEAYAAAAHAYARAGARSAFLVWDADNAAYTERWARRFAATFEELGGAPPGGSSFSSADPASIFAAAAAAAASRADAVILAADVLDAAILCQRIRLAGSRARFYASNWAMATDLVANGGEYVEGLVTFSNIDSASDDPRSAAFRAAYAERFGKEPIHAAFLGYECVSVLASAWGGSGSPASLGRAIVERSPHRGLQGGIGFSDEGAAIRELRTFVVRGGAFVREGRSP